MLTLPDAYFEAVAEQLRDGRTVRLRVGGNSMLPFLHDGREVITLSPVKSATCLRKGAVVFFPYQGKYIIHRIVGYRQGLYILQGDGNYAATETARREDIAGLLVRIGYPGGRVWDCTSLSWRCCSRLWRALRPLRPYLLRLFR